MGDLQPISLNLTSAIPSSISGLLAEIRPKSELFSKKDRLYGVIAVGLPILALVTIEAFTITKLYDYRLRNLLYVMVIITLLLVAYSVYRFNDVNKLTTVGYIYVLFVITAALAIIAGRIGYGLAITSAVLLLVVVMWLFSVTKEPLLIFPILGILGWCVLIVGIYYGWIDERNVINYMG